MTASIRQPTWTPPNIDSAAQAQIGFLFTPNVGILVSQIWFYYPSNNPAATLRASLWDPDDQSLVFDSGSVSTSGWTTDAWNAITVSPAVSLAGNSDWVAAVLVDSKGAGYDLDDLTNPITSGDGHVTIPAGGGRFHTGAGFVFPGSTWSGMHGVDIGYTIAAITGSVGIASETDTAGILARVKTRTVGVATQTDLAVALARTKARALGIAAETDAAAALARLKSRTVGGATTTDLAVAVAGRKTRAIGIASEVDTALALGGARQPAAAAQAAHYGGPQRTQHIGGPQTATSYRG